MKKLILLFLLLPIGVLAQNQARMISGTNTITACPYVIDKHDVTKLDVFISSSACAVTLPAATTPGFGKGSIFSVKNDGTGTVTITIGGGELIDGSPTVSLLPGAGMDIYSSGTGYSAQAGSGSGGGGGGGINPPAGDIGGNAVVPLVISTHLNSPLPILQGGTGTQTPALVAGTNVTITGAWPNQTINTTSSCWQNNGSNLPCEPFTNAVPPLVATDNSGVAINIACPAAVGVGGSHASGCVPDPGASGTSTDYLGRDMSYHTSGSAATVKPDPATGIQFVAGTCNGGSACVDGNDGLSWGTAKLTISAALQALPGASTGQVGLGTVFVGAGAVSNAAGSQYGIWMMGSSDPNYASPPTGWLKCVSSSGAACPVAIIGVPNNAFGPNTHKPKVGINASGGGSDTVHPAVWLSATAGVWISNLDFQYPGRGIVLGECSDNSRTGTCPVTNSTFENDAVLLNQLAANGPGVDITGASYWLWFSDFAAGGNSVQATGGRFDNKAAAMLLDGTGNTGNGLVHIKDTSLATGGIKVVPGTNGASLYADNVNEEGDFVHDIPPTVWFTSFPTQTDCKLSNIQIIDPGSTPTPAIQNDGTTPGCTVINTVGVTGPAITGPAVVLNQDPRGISNSTTSPRNSGQVGFFDGYLSAETDVARRVNDLVSARFNNQGASNTTIWQVSQFAGTSTLTQSVTDPFGGTNAATASSNNATNENLYLSSGGNGCTTTYTPTSGDWIVTGGWVQTVSGVTPPNIIPNYCSFPTPTFSRNIIEGAMQKGDGNWAFPWTANKVSGGSATHLGVVTNFSSTGAVTVYGPLLYIIPAGTLSDNEVLEFASSMNSIEFACPVGSMCALQGHPVSADSFSIQKSGFRSTISSATLAANRAITMPDPLASAKLPLVTGPITNGDSVCASGTLGVYIDCTGGGGGSGTVDAAAQFNLTYYNTAGTVPHVGGTTTAPTGPNSVPSFWVTIPTAGAPTAPQPILAGIPGRTVSGASDTILVTDRVSTVTYTHAGATAVSLPGAGTTGFGSNFCFKIIVQGASDVVTITPASGTINGGATQTVLQGQKALVCSFDNSNYIATINDPPATAGSNIALTRSDTGLAFASSAGGGTLTNAANSLPATQLICGNTYPDTLACDLSGDAATSGSGVVTVSKINGTAFSGTSGNLVRFGASNTPVDSAIAAANVVQAASAYTTGGDLVEVQTSSTRATNDSHGILAANVVTSTSNAGFAKQLCASASTNKVCAFTSLADVSSTDYTGVTTGAVNTMSGCPTNTATALTSGMMVAFLPNLANTTTTPSLNLCTLGAKTITKLGTAALVANDLITTAIAVARYDGTGWELQNPQTSNGGGSSALSSITAAAATNTIANGNFTQFWNSQQSTNTQAAFTFGETGASTVGTVVAGLGQQTNVTVSTAAGSTATPLSVAQGAETASSPSFPAFQVSSTWNNASLVGSGIVEVITNTTSNSSSKLINLIAGSGGVTSEFSVTAGGQGFFQGGIQTAGSVSAAALSTNLTYQGGLDGLTSGSANGAGTFRGAKNTSTTASSAGGSVVVTGGDETGTGANAIVGGNASLKGGDVTVGTGTGATAGNVFITAGQCNAVASASTCQGTVDIRQSAFTTGGTAGDLACVTAANTVASCTGITGTGQFVGVIDSVTSNGVLFTALGVGGTHTFNANSATFTNGHFVCQDTTASSGHLVKDSSTICTAGFGVGIYVGATGTQTAPLVMMRPY